MKKEYRQLFNLSGHSETNQFCRFFATPEHGAWKFCNLQEGGKRIINKIRVEAVKFLSTLAGGRPTLSETDLVHRSSAFERVVAQL